MEPLNSKNSKIHGATSSLRTDDKKMESKRTETTGTRSTEKKQEKDSKPTSHKKNLH